MVFNNVGNIESFKKVLLKNKIKNGYLLRFFADRDKLSPSLKKASFSLREIKSPIDYFASYFIIFILFSRFFLSQKLFIFIFLYYFTFFIL